MTANELPRYDNGNEPPCERRKEHDPVLIEILERINGYDIEQQLISIASVGGEKILLTPEQKAYYRQEVRYKTNRFALGESDKQARSENVHSFMTQAGMQMSEHPLALIGSYEGSDSELPPVVIVSHTDSIPDGDMYDGVLGVVGGINVVKAIHETAARPARTIMVMSLTGEESSRFDIALFGSRSLFHGLTDKELLSHGDEGVSIRDELGKDADRVKTPVFGPNGNELMTPYAAIELHVDQTGELEKKGRDLGVVDAIAAPERYKVRIGGSSRDSEDNNLLYDYSRSLVLTVAGVTDHSGATPMGEESRADGLVKTAEFLLPFLGMKQDGQDMTACFLESLIIDDPAMNKIPGITTTHLRVAAGSEETLERRIKALQAYSTEKNECIENTVTPFSTAPISLKEIPGATVPVFVSTSGIANHHAAMDMVFQVNRIATSLRDSHVVGTVSKFSLENDGSIVLGLDIRGKTIEPRNELVKQVHAAADEISTVAAVDMGDILPGSGDPVTLDPEMAQLAEALIEDYSIASYERTFSPAGHDLQNLARVGISSVMLFCQSKDGIAHRPDAYTPPENMEKGVKALAAMVWTLANQTE